MPSKRFWRDMPTTEFEGDLSDWIAVLPLAAVEQHGPHLPLGVDAMIAEGLVQRCAAALPATSPAVFLPIQEVGKSNEHLSYPGTLTVGWETAIRSWIEVGKSVARAGVRKLVLITSHGGNVSPMDIVARELRVAHGLLVVTTSWGRLGKWQEIYDYQGVFTDIHGGTSETSVMLALRPDLVEMGKAEDFASAQADLKARHRRLGYHGGEANVSWMSEDLNPKGTVGDATAADAAKGEADLASMVQGFLELIAEIAALEPPSPGPNRGA